MAKKKYDIDFSDMDGVWRTIGGRKVFIRKGQSLSDAMKESGKFKLKKNEEEKQDNSKEKQYVSKFKVQKEEDNPNFKEKTREDVEKSIQYSKENILRGPEEDIKEYEILANVTSREEGIKEKISGEEYKQFLNERIKLREEAEINASLSKSSEEEKEIWKQYWQEKENIGNKYKTEIRKKETYKPKKAYESYYEKMKGHGEMDSWTGKEYTNDEFMEHLTDSNWHSERKALEEAKLTNEELSYIKDKTSLSKWGVGEELTGKENVNKMIDEAKGKFRGANKEFHYAGEELYSDDPNRFGDKLRKINDKMNPSKNDDISPMSEWSGRTQDGPSYLQEKATRYFEEEEERALKNKDMSYGYSDKGLQSLSNKELDEYIKKQKELSNEYTNKYNQSLTYDQRTTRNRQDTVWNKGMKTKYEGQLNRANEEKVRREREVDKYFDREDYFGKEAYEKYGSALQEKYGGKKITKRIDMADTPEGLRTVAKELGAKDEFEMVEALEGMARNGKAKEISDGVFEISGNSLQQRYSGTIDYLQKTTNMSMEEILDLLRKRGK